VTSHTAHTKYRWPSHATEWTPSWKFSAPTPLLDWMVLHRHGSTEKMSS